MRRLISTLLLWMALLAWAGMAQAQPTLEIIELRHRTLQDVLPILQPLVEPGGTLSGQNNQLFLRASPRNQAEVRKALAVIDRPARQLMISVTRNIDGREVDRGGSARGSVVIGTRGGVDGEARVWDSREVRAGQGDYRVRTQEGSPALIRLGQSMPVPVRDIVYGPGGAIVREQIVYRDLGQGFMALPRLNGERVTIDILQQSEQAMGRGAVNSQQLMTSVSGRLGEWIELGGVGQESRHETRGTLSLSTRDVARQQSVWLKVEELP